MENGISSEDLLRTRNWINILSYQWLYHLSRYQLYAFHANHGETARTRWRFLLFCRYFWLLFWRRPFEMRLWRWFHGNRTLSLIICWMVSLSLESVWHWCAFRPDSQGYSAHRTQFGAWFFELRVNWIVMALGPSSRFYHRPMADPAKCDNCVKEWTAPFDCLQNSFNQWHFDGVEKCTSELPGHPRLPVSMGMHEK